MLTACATEWAVITAGFLEGTRAVYLTWPWAEGSTPLLTACATEWAVMSAADGVWASPMGLVLASSFEGSKFFSDISELALEIDEDVTDLHLSTCPTWF